MTIPDLAAESSSLARRGFLHVQPLMVPNAEEKR